MAHDFLRSELIRLMESGREHSTVEFKRNENNPDQIGQYLSALANAAALDGAARAWMIWGVDDSSRSAVGTTFDPFTQGSGENSNQSLIMWLQQMTAPRADFEFHSITHDGKNLVMLEIYPARAAPVAFKHRRYIRLDSHKVDLSGYPDREARLWSRLGGKTDWSGVVVPHATLADLDPDAIAMARKKFLEFQLRNESNPERHTEISAHVTGLDDLTLLNKARITKEGAVTRAALLLLGRDESAHLLSPVDAKISWILRDETNATRSSIPFGMPLLTASDKVYSQIRNIVVDHMPDGTLFPTPVAQYEGWVIREALHNCIAHQDYELGGKINVTEHPSKLVFSNLGQFMPESVEWMLVNQSPPEHYRNQWLIDGMIRMRMIDQAGSGIRRMFDMQRQRFFPLPDYILDRDRQGHPRVELMIQGQMLDPNFARALMNRTELGLADVLLLDRVQKGQPLTPAQIGHLRALHLMEGRAPKIYISAQVAATAGKKAQYIHNRGMDDRYYRDLVIEYLTQYTRASRADLDALLLEKLPAVLEGQQRVNKVKNLLQGMRRKGLIELRGQRPDFYWHLPQAMDIRRADA